MTPVEEFAEDFRRSIRPVCCDDPATRNYSKEYITRLEPSLRLRIERKWTTHLTITDMHRSV